MPRSAPSPLARVRRICLSLPETTERPSHGAPSFFIRDKIGFVNYMDDHHDDGRLALWCACPRGMREGLLKAEPEQYFVPPYVGFRGRIGVRLDRGRTGMRWSASSETRISPSRRRNWLRPSSAPDCFVSLTHAGVAKSVYAADLRSAWAQAL